MEGKIMNSRSKVITGSILVLAGATSLIGNLQILNENFILPILGAAFLFIYFILGARKKYGNIGFLIPGIILPALQILKLADDYNVGEKAEVVIVFGILGVSFLAIYLIHSCWYKELRRGQRTWPLHVSIILFIFGGVVYAIEYFNWTFGMVILNNIWPGVLVIVGVRMLYKALKGSKEKLND
jgi:hypothetical protein